SAAGTYTCYVTNACGGSFSNAIAVTVSNGGCGIYSPNVLTQAIIDNHIASATPLTGNWDLNSSVTVHLVAFNNTLTIVGANIAIAPAVQILVQSNCILNVVSGSNLFACCDMWDGIYLSPVGGGFQNNSVTVS